MGKPKVSTFSERLLERMEELNLRQTDVAQRTGLERTQMYHYMRGHYRPNAENLGLLARALDVTPEWLQGYDAQKIADYSLKQEKAIYSELFDIMDRINKEGHKKILDYARDIASMEKYKVE